MKRINGSKNINQKTRLVNMLNLSDSTYKNETIKRILTVLMYDASNFKDRNSKHKYPQRKNFKYIALTAREIYDFLYKEYRKEKFDILVDHLEMLSSSYDSMYTNNNHILDKFTLNSGETAYYYHASFNGGWNRVNDKYFPDIFNVNFSHKDCFNSNNNIDNQIFIATLAVIMEDINSKYENLIFTKRAVQEFFDITPQQFKTTCKQLGLKYLIKFDEASSREKRLANIQDEIITGIYFDKDSVKIAKEFLNNLPIHYNYKNLFITRMWFYRNNSKLLKKFFVEDNELLEINISVNSDNWDYDTFLANCYHQNIDKQVKLYYNIDVSSFTKIVDAEINFGYNHNKKSYNDNINKESIMVLGESLKKDLDETELVKSIENACLREKFVDFSFEVRNIFDNIKVKAETNKVAFTLKDTLISILSRSKNKSKDIFVNELMKINNLYDVFSSIMFNKDYAEFLEEDEFGRSNIIMVSEHMLKPVDIKQNSEIESHIISSINNVRDSFMEDILNYEESDFIIALNHLIDGYDLTTIQKNYINGVKRELEGKKIYELNKIDMKQKNSEITVNDIFKKEIEREAYNTIKDLRIGINTNKTSSLTFQYEMVYTNIKDLIKSYDGELNEIGSDNIKRLSIEIEESCINTGDEGRKTIHEELKHAFSEIGLTVGVEISVDDMFIYVMEIDAGLETIKSIVNSRIM